MAEKQRESAQKTFDSLSELERCATIRRQVETIDQGRAMEKRQMLINIAFMYGKHYFSIDRKPSTSLDQRIIWELKALERKKKSRRVMNYILPLVRSLLARMLMMRSHIEVEATTNHEQDRSAAKTAREALEDFWQTVNKSNPVLSQEYCGMMMILARLCMYLLVLGTGYLRPYYNPKARGTVYLPNNQKIMPDTLMGAVETKVLTPFTVYRDVSRRFIIEELTMHVDDIYDQYNVRVDPEEIDIPEYQKQIVNMIESSQQETVEDSARVYMKHELPTTKYPGGRLFICTDKKQLLDTELPAEYHGRLPYVEFTYLDFFLSQFAQSAVEQLIPSQEELNMTVSRLSAYKKWMAGKLLVPRSAKISAQWNDEVGQIIMYKAGKGRPSYEMPPNPPSFLLEDLLRIRRDMEDTAGSHDASMGRIPAQAKSGIAIENLSELDSSQQAPIMMVMEQRLSYFGEMVLEIMQSQYTVPRMMQITGDQYETDVRYFKGAMLFGNRRTKITIGSNLPYSKAARQEFIERMLKNQLITPDEAKRLMEFGDVEGIYHSLDEAAAKEEIQVIIKGGHQVVVEPWEDHTIHRKVFYDFMKTPAFYKLPEQVRQQFIMHTDAHGQYLIQEQQAAGQLAPEQPQGQPVNQETPAQG